MRDLSVARGVLLTSFAGLLGLVLCAGGCGSSSGGGESNHHKKPTPISGGVVWAVQQTGNSVTGYSPTDLETGGDITPRVTISGSNTGLNASECAALDSSGNLWVTSFGANSIVEFAAADLSIGGNLTPSVTIQGTSTKLAGPVGCAFDSAGNLWIADFTSFVVEAFSPANLASGGDVAPAVSISGGNTKLCAPQEITFDSSGNLWVANFSNSCGDPNVAEYQKSDLAAGGNVSPAVLISGTNTGLNTAGPFGLAFDASGNLWASNDDAVSEFAASDLVSGGNVHPKAAVSSSNTQMSTPKGIAFDPNGNLWAPQNTSNELTAYSASDLAGTGTLNLTPFSVVSGTSTKLSGPAYILFPQKTDLAVADFSDNRVLLYKPPFSNGEAASKVIGQTNFTSNTSGTTQSNLKQPAGVATDPSGNGWVADEANDRVLEFKPPFSTGMNASVVLGQPDFTTAACATDDKTLCSPFGVASDKSGDIWVADDANCRVLEFEPPFSNGMAASLVIGQPDFTTGTCSTTQATLNRSVRLTFDKSGDLWVAEATSNRVLEFEPPFSTGMDASLVLGQSDFTSSGAATTATGLSNPLGVAFDGTGDLWVADFHNCRALEYVPPFSTGMAASVVLGEPDFTTANCASGSASVLNNAAGVGVDSSGNVYVSDFGNARVLEFSPPFTSGMAASVVFGQTDFTGSSCDSGGIGATTLCAPEGLTIGNTP
jgi:sugar lactone lactonase YvrE